MTPEEAQNIGEANNLAENNLSSVEITKNSKGYNWKIKAKHEDPWKAMGTAQAIDEELRKLYGKE